MFDSLTDTTPTIFADLRTATHNYWDRGLLGIALHPNFPATPYVYVLYTYDHMPGAPAGAVPAWGFPARRTTRVRIRPAAPKTAASSWAGCRG